MPTTTTDFFINCRTIEEVKNRYRDLAKKYHPDLGGDTATMQAVNIEYAEAMRSAISNEENEYQRDRAAAGFEPLREAIEFAVTLPENVSVIIRGFWLWLEGETYLCKDRIKSFTSADGIRFRWSKHKQSWYFAVVPSSNRSGHCYSFEEIEAIHGREVVTERVRQSKLAA
jgi:curved DNA-binding protein CbpA